MTTTNVAVINGISLQVIKKKLSLKSSKDIAKILVTTI